MEKFLLSLLAAVLVVSVFVVALFLRKKNERLRLIGIIKERWGKNPLRYSKSTINENTHCYYSNMKDNNITTNTSNTTNTNNTTNANNNTNNNCNNDNCGVSLHIDDITWNDLDMDNVFNRINNTGSTVGEQYLYYLLRNPVFDGSVLKERERLTAFFQSNRKQRMDLQFLLAKLGKTKSIDITNYFLNEQKYASYESLKYKLLSIGFLLSPLLMIFNLSFGIFVAIAFLTTNITVYYKKKYEIEAHLEAFNYIVSLVDCADKISNLNIKEISTYQNSLKACLKKLKGVISKSFLVLYRTEDPFLEYVKVILLGEIIAYESMFKLILKYKQDLMDIFNTVGLIDSLISVASYRVSIDYYSRPELYSIKNVLNNSNNNEHNSSDSSGSGSLSKSVDFKDICHPLINNPVPNSLCIDKPILITGSNASGKSTFLKTIAINAIFAQTIYTCL
ncbi:MAG TPA: hypothetical protein PK733_11675, partial [Clostridiales bacterium]|nr:hypothetical protein [Clostridiales bacterium]